MMNSLPAPAPPRERLSLLQFLGTLQDNAIGIFTEEAYEQAIVQRKVLGRHVFIVSDPALIKHVMLDNVANYEKTEITRRILEPGLGKGLITLEKDTWRRHRRTMAPAFDHRSIAGYIPLMTAATDEMLADWDRHAPNSRVDVEHAMMEVTLHIISRTMFSSDSNAIVRIMGGAAGRYQARIRPNVFDLFGVPDWLAGRRRANLAKQTFAEFDAVIDRLIEARKQNTGNAPKDLLARLIAARDEHTGGGMSAQEVRDHVITIFMAGHETTAMAMTWTLFLLSAHPAEEAKLHAELETVLGGRAPTAEDLPKLTYARMVVEESMRIYPPVPLMEREALGEDVLAGRVVPRGSTVIISPWVIHRHKTLWENPGRFDPQRFLPENASARVRFSYLPFGGGQRICIGAAFAMTEAIVLLATIAQRYQLRLLPGHNVEPQGLITLRARYGLQMLLTQRHSAR